MVPVYSVMQVYFWIQILHAAVQSLRADGGTLCGLQVSSDYNFEEIREMFDCTRRLEKSTSLRRPGIASPCARNSSYRTLNPCRMPSDLSGYRRTRPARSKEVIGMIPNYYQQRSYRS
ncbi:hypothetical protein BDW69DRAFT_178355 [Aspergillus filifer]